jgi:hypothetical protein
LGEAVCNLGSIGNIRRLFDLPQDSSGIPPPMPKGPIFPMRYVATFVAARLADSSAVMQEEAVKGAGYLRPCLILTEI